MEKKTKNRAVVLYGATSVGKTGLTEKLFSTGYEIINADSIQVYKGLDILSAKPDKLLQKKIKHYLVDIREPWKQYTSGDFVNDSNLLISSINERGLTPLITGGTAYYLKMLCYSNVSTPKSDFAIRKDIENMISKKGTNWLYSEVERFDRVSFERINKNDIYRLSRALEVFYQTGRPLSSYSVSNTLRSDVDFLLIGLERDKIEMAERIKKRVDIMFEDGAIDEIRKLLKMGANPTWPSMQAIGYKEWLEALESGEYSLTKLKDEIVKNSIKYAKRQKTFFSSFKETRWFHPDDCDRIEEYILRHFEYGE